VDVEEETLVVVWVAFLEFPRYGTVAWADVVLDDFANYMVDVGDLGELRCCPVV
jgi:hypothetical protein